MNALDILLLIAALFNLVLFGIVILHSRKRLVETFFAVFALAVSCWSFATFLTTSSVVSFEYFKIGAMLHYVFGNLVFLFLFWFSFYFPYPNKSKLFPILATLADLVILYFVVFSNFLFSGFLNNYSLDNRIMFNYNGYLAISVITISMFIISQLNLLIKKLHAEFLDAERAYYIFLGTSITGATGLLTNLILPAYGNFSFFYIGPIITTPLFVGVMIYTILQYKLFNLKVIAAEIFTALLIVITAFNLLAAKNQTDFFIQAAALSVSIIFGYFLIRSVYQEVRSREEIERLAGDLEKANEELKKLDAAKSEFISLAGHQLRAPLTAIKGYSSMIIEGSFGVIEKTASEALSRIFASADQLVKITSDLLDLSRIESGRFRYDFVAVDFGEMTERAVKEFEATAKERGLELKLERESGASFKISADSAKIYEAIVNLIDNALKYSKPGGTVLVFLKMAGSQHGKKNLVYSVKDSGIGIKTEDLPKLFTKFARTDESKKVRPDGMGLGLYFVKKIVEDHGGRVWAESEGAGKGSVFYVELPLQQAS